MSESTLQRYQEAFSSWLGVRRAYAFWKGRVALYAILRALGVGPDDEVLLPGYTCVMNANPIKYLGATPVYVDVEPITYNLTVDSLRSRITPRAKAIIAQHTYGYPCDMGAVMEVARREGLTVIEDCCLALGPTYKGRKTGTFGVAAYFSFQWNKPYTSGLGGMAVFQDDALADKVAEIRRRELVSPRAGEVLMLGAQLAAYRACIYPKTTALAQNVFRWLTRKGLVVGSSDRGEFHPTMEASFFKNMSGMQARVGAGGLKRLEGSIAHRRRMARLYDELLGERGWPVPQLPAEIDPVLVRYPVQVRDKQRALQTAARHYVELGSWFECPLHPIETPMEAYDYHIGMCPVAERLCREVVNLPLHPRAGEKTARRTVEFITGIGPTDETT